MRFLALDPRVGSDDREPKDSLRAQRVQRLDLLINHSKANRTVTRKSTETVQSFSGTLRISGLLFRSGMTVEELIQMKSGIPLQISETTHSAHTSRINDRAYRNENDAADESSTAKLFMPGRGVKDGCEISVRSDNAPHWQTHPIEVVSILFEEYRQPSDALLNISLRPGEKILNAVHAATIGRYSFDAMLTNQRLFIHSSCYAHIVERELILSPEIIQDGIVVRPLVASDYQWAGKVILVGLIPMFGSRALAHFSAGWDVLPRYSAIVGAIVLALLSVFMLISSGAAIRQEFNSRAVNQSRLRTRDAPDLIFYHGSAIRLGILGYDLLGSFAERLRCAVLSFSMRQVGKSEV